MTTESTSGELKNRIAQLGEQLAKNKSINNRLWENQERFRLLYERAPMAYQSLDSQGCLLEVNKAWLDMLGYERHEVIGKSIADFISPEWQEHFRQNFSRFKSFGELLGIEFELRTREGQPVLVSVNSKIGYDDDGNFLQTHCILFAIPVRNQADRERDINIAELHEKLSMKD